MLLLEFKPRIAEKGEFCCSACGGIFNESEAELLEDEYFCYDCKDIHLDNIAQEIYWQETLQELKYWSL